MNSSDERKVTELETVLLVDIQEIPNPRCFEWKKWRAERLPHILEMEAMSDGTDIQPVLLETNIETYRAYRIGAHGFDEPVFVKAPVPKIFLRLLSGILSAYIRRIDALEDEVKGLKGECLRLGYAQKREDRWDAAREEVRKRRGKREL